MTHVTFAPDGRKMVTTHLGELMEKRLGVWRLRDGTTGKVLKEVQGLQHVMSAAFSPSGWLLAVATDKSVRVYDTPTWQEVARFDGHEGTVHSVFFGADDGTLVSASREDGTALVWSLKTAASPEPPDPTKLWADLAGDGPAIRGAVWSAAAHPEVAIRLFRQKWPLPLPAVDTERVQKLIGNLDSKNFAEREAAEAELIKLAQKAGDAVRSAARTTTSPEVRSRVNKILEGLQPQAECSPEEALELRAVWTARASRRARSQEAFARVGGVEIGDSVIRRSHGCP